MFLYHYVLVLWVEGRWLNLEIVENMRRIGPGEMRGGRELFCDLAETEWAKGIMENCTQCSMYAVIKASYECSKTSFLLYSNPLTVKVNIPSAL